ncbi:type III secretion system translocon subunit SctE [Hahella sp. CR1]|uniref:type III secretion system translocon subunit SctE n=1 Tax=Hahella sp. CR1 TaxID=2992807 RepID=UPI002441D330|nr:type III secretion system translocon subunit SctE [Hahella sp. CR1]MDG9672072.1 type III secretion system translocon subunit SctE [Hahella sp. CR1]
MSTIGALSTDVLNADLAELFLASQDTHNATRTSRAADSFTQLPAVNADNSSGASSLVALTPPNNTVDLLLAMQSLQVKLDEEGVKSGKEDAKFLAQENEARHKEVMEALQKSINEMEKAKKSGMFAKVFGWIAAAATLIAGAAMIATGAGAIAGGVMMALAVDQMVGMATGKSAVSELTNAIAKGLASVMGEPANAIVASVIVAAVLIIGTAGAGMYASAGASAGKAASVASNSSKTATTAASTGKTAGAATQAGSTASSSSQATMNSLSKLAQSLREWPLMHQARNMSLFVSSGAQVGGGAAGVDAAVHTKEANDAKAEEALVRKVIMQNQAGIEQAIEHIKSLTSNSESTLSQMVNYINQEQQTNQALIRDMA